MKYKKINKTIFVFLLMLVINIHFVQAQIAQTRISLNLKMATAKELFNEINRQTNCSFLYSDNDLETIAKKNYTFQNKPVVDVLTYCLDGTNLTFLIDNNTITIKQKKNVTTVKESRLIKGKVVDNKNIPIPFANIIIKNHAWGTASDNDGNFTLTIPGTLTDSTLTIICSFIGMKTQELAYKGQNELRFVMEEESDEVSEVVVTGIYQRKKESFTGASSTFTSKDLKTSGNQNVIQALRSLDPSFNVLENNQFGSDPNHLPDIEVRGKSSIVGLKETYGTDPNQPLFILDGFETSLQTIMDLNMNRIESVTILKDAASTAIYGSKAANGVIVIETKKPEPGKLRLSYKGDLSIDFPDLSGYNLMNAAEKLKFEKLAGRFEAYDANLDLQLDSLYRARQADVARGVNSYWLSDPLRTGVSHKHSLYVEGGDKVLNFGAGIDYNGITGVMKTSSRDIFSGLLDLVYRKGTLQFTNKLSIDWVKSTNPVVSFKEFAQANPYYRKHDENGEIQQYLEQSQLSNLESNDVQNPLWDNSLDNYNQSHQFGVRNNFIAEWNPIHPLKVRARLGITKTKQEQEVFYDPKHSKFNSTEQLKKGEYNYNSTNYLKYEGDLSVIYGALFNNLHQINAVGGWNISNEESDMVGFTAVGFANGDFNRPSFSGGYPEGEKSTSYESTSRATSFFLNFGYSFDNRYLLDANYRLDGSSIFGSNKRFTNTWSVGLAWNIHNEKFIRDNSEWLNLFKIRASIGNPGNQNFSSYLSYSTYIFNSQYLNKFGVGTSLNSIGNPNLKWQKTIDMNLGTDISVLNQKLNLTLDVYRKNTDPLFVRINVPASNGVTEINTNFGKQINTGISGTLSYSPIYRPEDRINWTVSVNARHEKGKYDGIENSLNSLNELNQGSKNYERYYDGGSPTAIWAVRSAGIDPATGRELFIKKNGETTFEYSFDDEVVVGNTQPDVEGVLSSSLYYKGFSFSFYLRYRLGGQVFNDALYNKVENISLSDLKYNQDKRALYDRWQKAGDKAKFKSIENSEQTPMSSRFVMDENTLSGESFQIGYEFTGKWLEAAGISVLNLQAYAANIFRISSVKAERGIEYPFARTVSFSLSLTF